MLLVIKGPTALLFFSFLTSLVHCRLNANLTLDNRVSCSGNSSVSVAPSPGHLPENDMAFNVGPWISDQAQLEMALEFCSYLDSSGRPGQVPIRSYSKLNTAYYRLGWGYALVAQYEVQNYTGLGSNGCVPWTTIDVATCMKNFEVILKTCTSATSGVKQARKSNDPLSCHSYKLDFLAKPEAKHPKPGKQGPKKGKTTKHRRLSSAAKSPTPSTDLTVFTLFITTGAVADLTNSTLIPSFSMNPSFIVSESTSVSNATPSSSSGD